MRLDAVDIFFLPSISRRETVLHEPYLEAYQALKRQGKTRFIGVATHSHEPEVVRAAVDSGAWDVVLAAFNFRQRHRDEVRAAFLREAADAGLGVVAMKTQAGVYWDDRRTRKINMKAALKWALEDEHDHTTIPAFSNFDELGEDLEVMRDPEMTPAERKDLELGAALGLAGLYCQQCGRCLPRCPAGLDIPTLMRGHMYAVGHRQPAMARQALRGWTASDIPCESCGTCTAQCDLGMDVRTRMIAMRQLIEA
jgi:predicted aldo/keto reductase-like oxidoreductase